MTPRSSAHARRPTVIAAAMRRFARAGYFATTIADVAEEADLSPAYVSKLFGSKERLFVEALDACIDRILDALAAGADAAGDGAPEQILDAMGDAYARLMADRPVLLLQVQAQSVSGVETIGDAFRRGLERVTTFAQERSRADDAAVQRFMAYGQLCHLIVTAGLDDANGGWARALTAGMTHPAAATA